MTRVFPPKPSCSGLPDCSPPDPTYRIISMLAVAALITVLDLAFFKAVGDDYISPASKGIPDTIPWIIGLALGSILFVELYIHYARRPMTSHLMNKSIRTRNTKGLVYGISIASIVFVPSVFIDIATLEDILLSHQLVHAAFRLVQFALCGMMVAHLLKKDPV